MNFNGWREATHEAEPCEQFCLMSWAPITGSRSLRGNKRRTKPESSTELHVHHMRRRNNRLETIIVSDMLQNGCWLSVSVSECAVSFSIDVNVLENPTRTTLESVAVI